jgi:hypothetical protein
VPFCRAISGVARDKFLTRVLSDCREHPVALAREAQEALLDERLQGVEVGVSDFLRRVQRAATGKDGEGPKEALLRLGEEVVAPLDGRPKRLLARIGVAATFQQVEA